MEAPTTTEQKNPTILVAFLDWGLGHASRCMPIIQELLQRNVKVILASNGRALALLRKEFPQLASEELPAYNIRYYADRMALNMLWQGPKILRTAYREYQALKKLIRQHRIQAVISDNRFGCFSRQIPCVFITHQLNIITPNPWLSSWINRCNLHIIRQYTTCWIPDFATTANLSGQLSHPSPLTTVRYIGPLSRLKPEPIDEAYQIVVLLSGPEPQRSKLENILVKQLRKLDSKSILIQGKTEQYTSEQLTPHCRRISYALTSDLNRWLSHAKVVICRSGYSTVMDMARLGKRCLFIPTPGQTEQEYLANYTAEKGWIATQTQAQIDVEAGIEAALRCTGFPKMGNTDLLTTVVDDFIASLVDRGR